MMCATNSSPPPSPAGSEISVGAPSPPPKSQQHPENDRRRNGDDYFRPLKRLKGIVNSRERSVSPPSQRSTLEGVKSFSIADILGHETNANNNNNSTTASNQHQTTVSWALHTQIWVIQGNNFKVQCVCALFRCKAEPKFSVIWYITIGWVGNGFCNLREELGKNSKNISELYGRMSANIPKWC